MPITRPVLNQDVVNIANLLVPWADDHGLAPDWVLGMGYGEAKWNLFAEAHIAPGTVINGQVTAGEDSYGLYQVRIQSHPHPDGGRHWLGLPGALNAANEMAARWKATFDRIGDILWEEEPALMRALELTAPLGAWDAWRICHTEGFRWYWKHGQGAVYSKPMQGYEAEGAGTWLYILYLKGFAGTPWEQKPQPEPKPDTTRADAIRQASALILRSASRTVSGEIEPDQGWSELGRAITSAQQKVEGGS